MIPDLSHTIAANNFKWLCPTLKILFVKTSSLGDVVHNCPAVSDAARKLPAAEIDWVVEEPFAAIAAMHASVRRVIPVRLRRWRGQWWRAETWSEIGAFRAAVSAEGEGPRLRALLESPGNRRPRWMVTRDRIRLTGLLRKKPW